MHVMRAFGSFLGVFAAGLAAVVVAAQEPRVDTGFPSGDGGSVFEVFPKVLTNAAGWKVDTASALKGKMFGLYFSAHWCGPCRGFTPQLVKFYQQVAAKSGFEIVFVSSDKTADDMRNYMTTSSMPWLAIPFDDPARKELKRRFRIRSIPTLVICGRDGKMLSANARWDVVMLGDGAVKAWEAPDYTPRTFADYRAANGSGGNAPRADGSSGNSAAPRRRARVRSRGGADKPAAGNPPRTADNPPKPAAVAVNSVEITADNVNSNWQPGPSETWHTRMDTALAAARREHKALFVLNTGSDWCGFCKVLHREVLANSQFIDLAREKLILVYLDRPRAGMSEAQLLYNTAVTKALRFPGGVPVALIFDENGRRIGMAGGYCPLDRYMSRLRKILDSPTVDERAPTPPEWMTQSPEQLAKMLEDLRQTKHKAAAEAAKARELVHKEAKFQIVAWGLDKDKVDQPFAPDREIRIPAGKQVFFRGRYHMPDGIRGSVLPFVRGGAVRWNSGIRVSGNGDFVTGAGAVRNRPSREDKIVLRLLVHMPESRWFVVAELPCRLVCE